MASRHPLLNRAEQVLRSTVAPQAAVIDRDPGALRSALQQLGQHSLLALRVPQRWGGAEVDELTFRQFQELVTRYSGALAFLQAQHQSAGGLLARSQNESLQQAYLPGMATGKTLVGISFAHLRRDIPPVKAIAVPEGYQLHGQAPWVTGWGFFQSVIVAAVLPDGQAVYGMVPFETTQQVAGGRLTCSKPMELAAMTSTATVTLQFEQWLVPPDQVVSLSPVSAVAISDRMNVLQHSLFALGCARAALDIVATNAREKGLPFITAAYEALMRELTDCRDLIYSAQPTTEDFETRLQWRAWSIELAVRCAHAAIAASSGAANSCHHPAQRVYREALMFTVSGQTTAVMEATLARLIRPS